MMSVLKINLLFILLLLSGFSHADEVRYYDFELIIFQSLDDNARISESWRHEAEMDVPALAVELGQPYPGPIPKGFNPKLAFKVLPKNTLQLLEEAKLLTASRNYRVLLHTGWRQPGMDAETALPIHIKQSFLETSQVTPQAYPRAPSDMPASNLPTATTETQTRSILNGYIKIILSRYLHADIDLTYTTNIPLTTTTVISAANFEEDAEPIALPQPIVYSLKQTRKMRSKEVHYIDHPVIGVILLATPYDNTAIKKK